MHGKENQKAIKTPSFSLTILSKCHSKSGLRDSWRSTDSGI